MDQVIDWTKPCEVCGKPADRVVYGNIRDCNPDIKKYLCKECEDKLKEKQS